MSRMPYGYRLDEMEISKLGDEALAPIVAGFNTLRAERRPRHVEVSIGEFRVFSVQPGAIRHHYLVTGRDGAPAGILTLSYPDDGSNPRTLEVSISVLPDHRRRGVGAGLLRFAVVTARDLGRSLLSGSIADTVPAGESFVEAIGAKKALDMHHNAVAVANLDLEMLGSWREEGPPRGPGYAVEVVEGLYPEELLERIAPLYDVLMRDAPTPESYEPREHTPELIKGWITNLLEGADLITAIAIDRRTEAPVGLSQLGRRHRDETTWFVTTTMVDPQHRGHALGKWLKAAACLEALERWPGAEWMETGNAFTNEAVLGINHAMGFRHEFTISEVEIDVDTAEAYLASRSG